jgi:hypothetical protein
MWLVLAIIVVCAVAYAVLLRDNGPVQVVRPSERSSDGDDDFDFAAIERGAGIETDDEDESFAQAVHGESHYQAALEAIAGKRGPDGKHYYCKAVVELEPTNIHDTNAAVVKVEGRVVGYLPREDAPRFAVWAKREGLAAKQCDAEITGGWDYDGSQGSYGIVLDLRIPER